MTTIERIKALAEKATPGPWEQLLDGWTVRRVIEQADSESERGWRIAYTHVSGTDRVEQEVADAAYIAAIDPQTVLLLLAEVEAIDERGERTFILGMRAAAELVRGYGPARLDIIAAANKLERQNIIAAANKLERQRVGG